MTIETIKNPVPKNKILFSLNNIDNKFTIVSLLFLNNPNNSSYVSSNAFNENVVNCCNVKFNILVGNFLSLIECSLYLLLT